jgi:apolipoprotein N-acyltransferase
MAVGSASRATGRRRVALRCLLALVGGVGVYVASPPRELWWLVPVSFAVFAAVVRGRSGKAGFGYGFLFGVAYLLPLLGWLDDFLGAEFGIWPWVGLTALEAVFFGVAGAGMALVSRLPAAPVWMAAVFVMVEGVRSRVPYGGFPWGRIAFTQPEGLFLSLAGAGGAVLVGFAVVLTGCGLAVAAAGVRRGRWRVALALAVLPVAGGAAMLPTLDAGAGADELTVAVVQGNAPDDGIRLRGRSAEVRTGHVAAARDLVADVEAGRVPAPDLVVFPESSTRFEVDRRDPDLDRLTEALGVPALAGGIAEAPDGRVSNRTVLWNPGRGAAAEYAKQRLVPFGEFVPLRGIAAAVTPFADDPSGDLVPGDRPGLFDVGAVRVGVAICYEVAYDDVLAATAGAGARLLVVPTNNAWYGRSEMTYQQLAMARVRAVEHGRAVVVASTSGVSAIVLPDGTVTARTGQFTAETLVGSVPLRSDVTIATTLGAVPEWVLTALAAGAVVASVFMRGNRGAPQCRRIRFLRSSLRSSSVSSLDTDAMKCASTAPGSAEESRTSRSARADASSRLNAASYE